MNEYSYLGLFVGACYLLIAVFSWGYYKGRHEEREENRG
jgi:hypothetical protein